MKYLTIYEEIKELIQNNSYHDGEKIPSLRVLAKEYSCSIETIKHALQLLVNDNLIYAKNRSGFFVLQKEKMLVNQVDSDIIDFGSTKANEFTFPYTDFQKCLTKATENYKPDFFSYGDSKGLPELIQTLKDWFTTQQIYATDETIYVTTSIQQALFILCHLTFPNLKKNILIEEPAYHLMNYVLQTEQIPYFTIKRDQNGLNWTLLEYYFKEKNIKFFYTSARISSPLGLNYSESEKKHLIDLANKYDVYLVEDDYLADFIDNPLNLPLHFYDVNQRVIYLKSFSKIMFPGLRIGACVLPNSLVNTFQRYKNMMENDSSMFSQAALNLYIKTDMFDKHIKHTKKTQKIKDQTFIQTVKSTRAEDFFALDYFQTYKTFIQLPDNVSQSLFEKSLTESNVILNNIDGNFQEYKKQSLYGLELLNPTSEQITIGINTIKNALENSIK